MSLSVVSVPIGHPKDITLRAIETLKEVDFLICEELREGRKLLRRLDIQKELVNINEHTEAGETDEIVRRLEKGERGALFSDCGTPLFADPGVRLVDRCHAAGIPVRPVPGASSLMSALSVAGVSLEQFYYAGFLPRGSQERRREIRRLLRFACAVVIYDTPYRLVALLEDLKIEMADRRSLILLLSLTKRDEEIRRGSPSEILERIGKRPKKREFVLIVEPDRTPPPKRGKPARTGKRG